MLKKVLVAASLTAACLVAAITVAQTTTTTAETSSVKPKYFVVISAPNMLVAANQLQPTAGGLTPAALTSLAGALSTAELTVGTLGRPYTQALTSFLTINENYAPLDVSWYLGSGSLPPGMALDYAGVISGSPDTLSPEGNTFEVVASYKALVVKRSYTIKVVPVAASVI